VHTIAKITSSDYPELLAAVDAGVSQRELARRYDCARSLIARHVAKAKRARELGDRGQEPDLGLAAEPHTGSMREILEARLRDPNTSARDLASLTNALTRLKDEETLASGPPITYLRRGTLILEPEPKTDSRPEQRYRLMLRVSGGLEHVADGLTNRQAWAVAGCGLGLATPEDLGVPEKPER
jgi:transposase-like protein